MTTCAVLGSPIEHSLSPALHRAAYAELGLDWHYERHEVHEGGLADFVAACGPDWRGLSLTMPLKGVAMTVGTPDATAELVGAANTLVFGADGTRTVHNTDVAGMVDAVGSLGVQQVDTAVLLGSGATARSAVVSLSGLGCRRIVVVARSAQRAGELGTLADRLGIELVTSPWADPVPESDLLISTVTSGAADDRAEQAARTAPVVFDVLYDPWPTALAASAVGHGAATLSGLDLLAHQAVGQLELMTGQRVSADLLLSAGRAELSARHHR